MLHDDITLLAAQLAGRGPFDAIVGIPRGGLVVAAGLGWLLDVPRVGAHGRAYERAGDGVPVTGEVYARTFATVGARVLIVEDAVVTGTLLADALGWYRVLAHRVTTAALYVTRGAAYRPDVWVHEVDQAPSGKALLGLGEVIIP